MNVIKIRTYRLNWSCEHKPHKLYYLSNAIVKNISRMEKKRGINKIQSFCSTWDQTNKLLLKEIKTKITVSLRIVTQNAYI